MFKFNIKTFKVYYTQNNMKQVFLYQLFLWPQILHYH